MSSFLCILKTNGPLEASPAKCIGLSKRSSFGKGHFWKLNTKIYNTRQKSWNTCAYFPFPNVDLGITVVSVLQNMRGSTLGRENAHFRGETVWSINLRIFPDNSRERVSVSTICDEYCLCVWRAWTGNVNVGRVIIVACSCYVGSVLVLTVLDMK